MKSVFSPEVQTKDIDSRIISALERISEAFRILFWDESKNHSLSPMQIQILIFLHYHKDHDKKTITYLAREFNLTKATVSDSVKSLLAKKILLKKNNISDKRSYYLELSSNGRNIAAKLSSYGLSFKEIVSGLSEARRSELYHSLVMIIKHLYDRKIINVQRMCFNCRYYNPLNDSGFYCKLLSMKLKYNNIRIDCPDHMPIAA